MDYKLKSGAMISSSGVVIDSIFDRYEVPKRPGYYWFVKHGVPNRAEYVFYGSPYSTHSEGMAGRIIPFKCTDGQTINIQGPWWSNADSFRESTGIDITNEYLTFVLISRQRQYNHEDDSHTYIDVVFKDDELTLGPYDRYKHVLRDVFTVVNDEKLFLWHGDSHGSGCHSYEKRSDWL